MSIYHHTLFNRAAWESHEATKSLRNNRWLIPPLECQVERQIHADIAVVPLLDPVTAIHVRQDFQPVEGNFVASMYSYIRSVENAIRHPKSSALQKTLGALSAQAVELQIPYVEEGLIEDDRLQPLQTRSRELRRGEW